MPSMKILEESVAEIFMTMSSDGIEVPVDFARDWIEENVTNKSSECVRNVSFLEGPLSAWVTMKFIDQETIINRCSKVLQTYKDRLIAVLVYLGYTYKQSKNIVVHLLNQFEYSILYAFLIKANTRVTNLVFLDASVLDVNLITTPMAVSLLHGCCPVISIPGTHNLLPFYYYLGSILLEIGFPIRTYQVLVVNEELNVLVKKKNTSREFFPFIVYNDADIYSASENAVSAICDKLHPVPWSVTHFYVEEGVYDLFVKSVQDNLKKMSCGSRFSQSTDFDLEYFKNQKSFNVGNLQIFQPFEDFPIKLCIGWDPVNTDLSEDLIESTVTILPFRNQAEISSILNKKPKGSFSCVWSESLRCFKNIFILPFDNIWVNCYAVFDASVPVDGRFTYDQQTVIYSISSKLLARKDDYAAISNYASSYGIVTETSFNSNKYFKGNDYGTAVNDASKAAMDWGKKSIKQKLFAVMNLRKHFSKSVSFCFRSSEVIEHLVLNFDKTTAIIEADNCSAMYIRRGSSVVVIYLQQMYELASAHLYSLIFCLLSAGNAVVIATASDITAAFAVDIVSHFMESKVLLVNMLSVVKVSCTAKNYCDILLNNLSISRLITLGLNILEEPTLSALNTAVFHISPSDNNLLNDIEFIKCLSTHYKTAWIAC